MLGLGALALSYPLLALAVTLICLVAIVLLLRWLIGWVRRAAAPPVDREGAVAMTRPSGMAE